MLPIKCRAISGISFLSHVLLASCTTENFMIFFTGFFLIPAKFWTVAITALLIDAVFKLHINIIWQAFVTACYIWNTSERQKIWCRPYEPLHLLLQGPSCRSTLTTTRRLKSRCPTCPSVPPAKTRWPWSSTRRTTLRSPWWRSASTSHPASLMSDRIPWRWAQRQQLLQFVGIFLLEDTQVFHFHLLVNVNTYNCRFEIKTQQITCSASSLFFLKTMVVLTSCSSL